MKLINSSVEIIPQEPGLLGVYKQIELAGRTAYKSEDKITEDSAKQFVDMIMTQRAFQANSKTITTGDTMLEEIINIRR